MKSIQQSNDQIISPHHKKMKPKQKRFIRLGCTALALTLAMIVGIMTGILPGRGMTAYAAQQTFTVTWDFGTFRTLASGDTKNGITLTGGRKSKNGGNLYSQEPTTLTAPEGAVFTQIEFPTTSTNITADSANTGTFSVVDYTFYSTQDRKTVNGKMVTWTGNSDTVSFTNKAYAIEYITFTLSHDHTLEWVTDTEATCVAAGEKHQECPICHEKKNEGTAIPATGNHTWEWVTDTEATCVAAGEKHQKCSVCNATQSEGTPIPATGNHTWEWVTDTEPTEIDPGKKHEECTVCHATQSENTEIPARGADDYAFTADSKFTWTKGSKDGLPMVIKNTSGDDTATFGKLVDVYLDDAKLTRDTDYTAESGSIKLTLSADYLNNLSTGEHTLKVELTVTTIEHTFTIAAPASTDSPTTGESILLVTVSAVLMILAVCGVAYVLIRRRMAQA